MLVYFCQGRSGPSGSSLLRKIYAASACASTSQVLSNRSVHHFVMFLSTSFAHHTIRLAVSVLHHQKLFQLLVSPPDTSTAFILGSLGPQSAHSHTMTGIGPRLCLVSLCHPSHLHLWRKTKHCQGALTAWRKTMGREVKDQMPVESMGEMMGRNLKRCTLIG